MMRSLMHMPTDHTPSAGDVVGAQGTVVTDVPDGGYGEVSLRGAGQVEKYNARGTEALRAGRTVEVVEVLSASSVLVRPADADSPPADDAGDGRTQP
jgi:membrane protein implicated in regulation of membrane protease activity